jgi:hypothetical protein
MARNLLIGFRDLAVQLVLILYDCSVHNVHPACINSQVTLTFLGSKDPRQRVVASAASATLCRINGRKCRAAAPKNPMESSSVGNVKGSWAAPIVVVGEDLEDHHNLVGQVLLRDQLPVAELHAIQVHLNALCRHLAPEGDG